jgi:hypothetical protein
MGKHGRRKTRRRNFFRGYFVWFITFSIASWIAASIIDNLNLNFILLMILAGFILESLSKIMQILIFKNTWRVDKYYLFWIVIHSINFLIATFLTNYISGIINLNLFFYYLIVGLIIIFLVRFTWKINLERKVFKGKNKGKTIIIAILLIIILTLIFNPNFSQNTLFKTNTVESNSIETNENSLGFFEKLSGFFNKLDTGQKNTGYYEQVIIAKEGWDGCIACDSAFGKGNVFACGGIPKYDFFGCGLKNSDTSVVEMHQVDILTREEISREKASQRVASWNSSLYADIEDQIEIFDQENVGSGGTSNGDENDLGFFEKLSSFFGNLGKTFNSCPQIDVPILSGGLGDYITALPAPPVDLSPEEFGGFLFSTIDHFGYENAIIVSDYYKKRYEIGDGSDPQDGWSILIYSISLLGGFGPEESKISCHSGNTEGENPTYFYCDAGLLSDGIPFLAKTKVKSDGTIGETITKSFTNIYGPNKEFIKTVCGKSPDKILEDEYDDTIKEGMRIFG